MALRSHKTMRYYYNDHQGGHKTYQRHMIIREQSRQKKRKMEYILCLFVVTYGLDESFRRP